MKLFKFLFEHSKLSEKLRITQLYSYELEIGKFDFFRNRSRIGTGSNNFRIVSESPSVNFFGIGIGIEIADCDSDSDPESPIPIMNTDLKCEISNSKPFLAYQEKCH